jgi:hypothetical protein
MNVPQEQDPMDDSLRRLTEDCDSLQVGFARSLRDWISTDKASWQ